MSNAATQYFPILLKFSSLEAITREPWSEQSALYVTTLNKVAFDNSSPESLATFILLTSLNLKFEVKFSINVNEMSPSGKGPLLKCGKFIVGEFEPIMNFCFLKGFQLFDFKSEANKKYLLSSYIVYIQANFSDLISYNLWKSNTSKQSLSKAYEQNYPWPLSKILYYSEKKFCKTKMEAKGIWKLDSSKLRERFDEVFDSLDRKLKGNSYLLDNNVSEVDILLFSYLKVIFSSSTFQDVQNQLNRFNNLMGFYYNLNEKFGNILKDTFDI